MKVYELAINKSTICEVRMDVPAWLPVKPRLSRMWLRTVAAQAISEFFNRSPYLGCDTRTGSTIFN